MRATGHAVRASLFAEPLIYDAAHRESAGPSESRGYGLEVTAGAGSAAWVGVMATLWEQ